MGNTGSQAYEGEVHDLADQEEIMMHVLLVGGLAIGFIIVFMMGWMYGDSIRACKCKDHIAAEGYYGPQK